MALFSRKQSSVPDRRARRIERDSIEAASGAGQKQTFQRNRTLTGSLSSEVRGVGEHRAELKSARVQAHDLRHHRRRLFGALVGVMAAVGILGFLVYQSIGIPTVTITGATTLHDTNDYAASIQQYLNAHPFERSRLTLDTNRLATYLQENNHPEIATVSPNLSFGGLGVATFQLTPRKPVVSWKTGATTMYVDNNGNAFARNFYAAPAIEVVDETGIQTSDNQVLVSNRFLGFIGKAVGRLHEQGYTVTKIVLPANTTRQILVSLDGVGYPVKLSVDRPAGEQAQDTARAVRYLAKQGIAPREYVDVRISGRAYYK